MQPNITPNVIKVVQNSLNKHYKKNLKVDGKTGNNTNIALKTINVLPHEWGLERKMIGYIQHICNLEDIDAGPVDGFWGPQTEYGYEILRDKLNGVEIAPWRDDEGIGGKVRPEDRWPLQTQDELTKFYGKVGTNQVTIRIPYPLKIAWDLEKTVTKITCHSKVSQSLLRILTEVKNHYGMERIKALRLDLWGGGLNVRKIRGGTKWSTHAWGIAQDWDPARNKLKWGRDKAQLAQPEYEMWWKFWEDERWGSLGRERNFDWMHIQAAKIKKN